MSQPVQSLLDVSSPAGTRVPFGGVKRSGYGRELAEPRIKELVNRKPVWVE